MATHGVRKNTTEAVFFFCRLLQPFASSFHQRGHRQRRVQAAALKKQKNKKKIEYDALAWRKRAYAGGGSGANLSPGLFPPRQSH